MIQGKIIRGIAGFYYVHVAGSGVYECKARGLFRKEKQKPLVGDLVEMEVIDEADREGNITVILPRKNELARPAVANIDQALVVFAAASPRPHFNLLDRFLVSMEMRGIPAVLCINKTDLASREELAAIEAIYRPAGYPLIFVSARTGENIPLLKEFLKGKTTAAAGPSGVGKSSLTNLLQSEVKMETGEISKKIERGKHTTRHSELICLGEDSYMIDTPGFGSLYVSELEKEQLKEYFPEIFSREGQCRFQGCSHIHEPDCMVKAALEAGEIHRSRYESYLEIYGELKEKKRY